LQAQAAGWTHGEARYGLGRQIRHLVLPKLNGWEDCRPGLSDLFVKFFERGCCQAIPISDTLAPESIAPAEVMKSLQIALPFWMRAILLVGVICILAGAGLI
jgi:hypothetical protein